MSNLSVMCYSCKTYHPDNASHCSNCGHILLSKKISQPYAVEKIFKFIVFTIAIAAVAIFVFKTGGVTNSDHTIASFGREAGDDYTIHYIVVKETESGERYAEASFSWDDTGDDYSGGRLEVAFYDRYEGDGVITSASIPTYISGGESAKIKLRFNEDTSELEFRRVRIDVSQNPW